LYNPNASEEQQERADKWLHGKVSHYPKGRPRRSRSGTGGLAFLRGLELKTCKDCGCIFEGTLRVVRCIPCRDKVSQKKTLRDELRDTYGRKCPWCGEMFQPHRTNQMYCTTHCRSEHNNALRLGKHKDKL